MKINIMLIKTWDFINDYYVNNDAFYVSHYIILNLVYSYTKNKCVFRRLC